MGKRRVGGKKGKKHKKVPPPPPRKKVWGFFKEAKPNPLKEKPNEAQWGIRKSPRPPPGEKKKCYINPGAAKAQRFVKQKAAEKKCPHRLFLKFVGLLWLENGL